MQIELRILRYDPERDAKPHWESYDGRGRPEAGPGPGPAPPGEVRAGRLAHVPPLLRSRRLRLGRHAHQRPQPARLQGPDRASSAGKITIAPLPGLPVVKDLVVDMEGFFAKLPERHAVPGERRPAARSASAASRHEERARYDDTTKCILCAACTTSCPSFWAKPAYVGPAAIVNAHRFIFDTRDEAADERLEILADKDGVWRCRTIFNCTDACPRGIHITQAILEVSSAIVERRT